MPKDDPYILDNAQKHAIWAALLSKRDSIEDKESQSYKLYQALANKFKLAFRITIE